MSEIIGHSDFQENPENTHYWFEWIGPEDGMVPVAIELLGQMPDLLNRLPWKLTEVGRTERTVYFKRVNP